MARKSKKNISPDSDLNIQLMDTRKWKTGIYARLSVDHHDRKLESIDSQIEIAKKYISQQDDMELIDCYSDIGKTGTNFERESFERLMTDIRKKKINCIVVKDFSRFGRNYIETGNYVDKVFPFLNVRFVSVTDNYDSEMKTGEDTQLAMHLKNIVNELYAKDISEKVKASKKVLQDMGSYTGGQPPYGYREKRDGTKRILVPDEKTREVVVKIYVAFLEGKFYKEIVAELYESGIQPPRIYYQTGQVYCPEGGKKKRWSTATIKSILASPVYAGDLIQARTCSRVNRTQKRHHVSGEEMSVVENTHEALISRDWFERAAERFVKQSIYANSDGFSKTVPITENVFRDILFCGECGRKMQRNHYVKEFSSGDRVRFYYYLCPGQRADGSEKCFCESISVNTLSGIVEAVLEKEFSLSKMKDIDYCKRNSDIYKSRRNFYFDKKEEASRYLAKNTVKASELYLDYRMKRITQQDFAARKQLLDHENEVLQEQIQSYENEIQDLKKTERETNRFIRALVQQKTKKEFDKELLECLIKRITVFTGHRIEILFAFRREDIEALE